MGLMTGALLQGCYSNSDTVDVMCSERKHRLQSGSFVKERELGIQLNKELDFPS